MPENTKTCDVFISYSTEGATYAKDVADACRASGLEAVTLTELLPSQDVDDALWEALAESRALLVILSPSGPTTSMAIEIGAARAWNKPIFAIVIDPSSTRLPRALSDIRLFTPGRIQDVIEAIDLSSRELSDEDRAFLIKLYPRMNVSVDQLILNPGQLGDLVKKFNRGRHKDVSGERLLSELLRMRKQGKLMKKTSRGQSRSHSDSA
jgi:hypothetical protein